MWKRFNKDYPTKGKNFKQVLNDFRGWQSQVRDKVTRKQNDAIHDIIVDKTNIVAAYFMRNGKEQVRFRDTLTGWFTSERPKGWKD